MSDENQAEVMAVPNKFIVALARKLGFSSLASACRHFEAQLNLKLAPSI